MAFLEQNRNTLLCYCVPNVSLAHTMADTAIRENTASRAYQRDLHSGF